jgi:hypothetical protein
MRSQSHLVTQKQEAAAVVSIAIIIIIIGTAITVVPVLPAIIIRCSMALALVVGHRRGSNAVQVRTPCPNYWTLSETMTTTAAGDPHPLTEFAFACP